jgi:membrane protein implicated in regulation of membrane protease activity
MTVPGSLLWVYGVPMGLAVMGGVGVTAALMGDGWWDGLSWAALGVMTAGGLWPALRRTRYRQKAPPVPIRSRPDRR